MGPLCGDVSIDVVRCLYIPIGDILGCLPYYSILPDNTNCERVPIRTLAINTVSAIGVFAENPGPYLPEKIKKEHFKETCDNCKVLFKQAVDSGSFIDHYTLMGGTSHQLS